MSRQSPNHAGVVDAIYRAAAEPDLWPDALTQAADYVGAIGGMLAYHAPAGQRSFMVTARLRPDLDALYLQRYAANPYAQASSAMPVGKALAGNTLVDVAAVRGTAFHTDILAPQAIEDFAIVTHASLTHPGSAGGFSFPLSRRQAGEAGSAARRLDRLAPHLLRATDLTLQLGRHQSGAWSIAHLLDAMPGAALLLDRNGGILRTNMAADALLAEGDGLVARKGGRTVLSAALGMEARLLSAGIVRAVATAEGKDSGLAGTLRITRPSGRPALLLLVTPLPSAAFSLWEAVDGGARAMVQVIDPSASAERQAERLQAAVGLTRAEARVAALIGGGASASEAAAVLGVSLTTIKTHLSRCFDKTGVRTQVGLARLVTSIP